MNKRDESKNQKSKKPVTEQLFQNGTIITYPSGPVHSRTTRTAEILVYVPRGVSLAEALKAANVATLSDDINKDVGLDRTGPKYLVREEAKSSRARPRHYLPSAGTVNAGTAKKK